MRKLTLLLCALLAGISLAVAQTSISGTVLTAEDDEPVIGASILVKGTNASTITDNDGKFSIKIPEGAGRTLVITYIGMERQEVFARNGMVVKLTSSDQALDDVVVVGYQTIRKEAKTGSIATVKGDDLASIPETSVDKMLSGKMAGVSVSSTNGQPGSAATIRVRGTSSIGAGSDPLYVVDGIPVESGNTGALSNSMNAIAMINASDIASVTVLKDAAAASIYGSRAANGVILITTKSGEAGKSKITARARYGVTTLANDNDFGMANLQEYIQYQRDARINAGYDVDNPASEYYFPLSLAAKGGTNWMKELTRNGSLQEYELIASGGTGKTTYYTSLSYNKTEGIVPTVGFEKMQVRANLDTELNKWLKVGTRINAGYMKVSDVQNSLLGDSGLAPSNPFYSGMALAPTMPAYNEDGSYNFDLPFVFNINPLAAIKGSDKYDKQYKFNGTAYLEWKPIKQLTFRTNNSVEYAYTNSRQFSPSFINKTSFGASLNTADVQYRLLTTSNTVTYDDLFNDVHSLNIMLGQEANTYESSHNQAISYHVNEQRPYHSVGVSVEDQTAYDGLTQTAMVSFFGVAEYSYDGRYYIKGSLRTDGSSKFGPDRRWGTFWAASASWNIHNEAFMQDIKNVLNVLKLRYSYGVNGNDNIAAYAHYGLYSDIVYNGITGQLPSQLQNRKLTWETNKTHNIGVDFRLFDRLSGSIDWYTRRTEDMLIASPLPYTTGFSSQAQNVGQIRNSGIEVQLDADIFNTNDFKWSAGVNFAANRSKVLELAPGQDFIGTSLRYVVGEQLYTYWLYDYAGVNPQNGNALWRNEEGLLTENSQEARRINAGSPEPLWTGGFNTELSWKGLSLGIQLEARYGNKVLNQDRSLFESDGYYGDQNIWKGALNYWKQPGDMNVLPKPVYNNSSNSMQTSTRYLEDGSYLRIKDITLAYNLPSKWTKKALMSGVRIYASALNLYTFHNMNYWDPEHGTTGATVISYPMTRSMIVGVDITF
ncbi:TonB-dependent receptor [uncultured Barnesiella sp.]|uniref:SusC/RagA family TonB-linked outer membrane protein n=1 Tax=uncultured Barnesiella sp. TaxID=584861 RepID=UPI0026375179|nr:TonB-dependent receptor [uncultured Barnesiella sp.]